MSEKHYTHFLTTTEYFKLDVACIPLWRAWWGNGGVYLVGSAITRPDWRDVDIRAILDNLVFDRLFPDADKYGELCPLWKIICVSVSNYLSSVTGLPVDFQIQKQSRANEEFNGPRSDIGLYEKRAELGANP